MAVKGLPVIQKHSSTMSTSVGDPQTAAAPQGAAEYRPRSGRRLAAFAALTVSSAVVLFTGVGTAEAAVPDCSGDGKFLSGIEVAHNEVGDFIISAHPTSEARRYSAFSPSQRDAVVEEWHAIQRCVPGLYGDLADSIWQQLECHQRWAYAWNPQKNEWATGDTYDLESYHPRLEQDNFVTKSWSRCGNALGVVPGEEFTSPLRPDAGVTDLEHAYDNIG